MELYPIRIDVSYPPKPSAATATITGASDVSTTTTTGVSTTGTSSANHPIPQTPPTMIQIIDTWMIDPKLLISLSSRDLHQRHVIFTQWAHSMISDALVVGVTKMNNNNNNNTISSTSTGSNTKNTTTTKPTTTSQSNNSSNNNNKNTSSSSDVNLPATSSSSSSSTNDKRTVFTGRYSIVDTTSTATHIAASSIHDYIVYYDSLMEQAIQQIRTQFGIIEQYEQIMQRTKYIISTTRETKDTLNTTLIPIQLRMELPGNDREHSPPIRYQDDFLWDPSNQFLSPIQMAQSIVNDLRLSHDTIPIITIHILEQIIQYHTTNRNDVNTMDDDDDDDDDEGIRMGPSILWQQQQQGGPPFAKRTTTAAWEISPAIHNTNMIHFDTFQKRPDTTATTTATK